jgi:hypothetical protein
MKYSVPDHAGEYKNRRKYTEIGYPGGKSVKVYEDGSIEAHSFVDKDHENLDYDFDKEKNAVFFKKNINHELSIKYVPNAFKVYYEAVCKKTFSIVKCFGKIISNLKSIPMKTTGRYEHARKIIRKEIDKLLGAKKVFIFTEENSSGERVAIPYKESKRFGPYNYPVKLKTSKDVDFINDILIVKTGSFLTGSTTKIYNKSSDKIVYISPHVEKSTSGVYSTSTGVNYLGNTSVTTGQGLSGGLTSDVSIKYITSEDYVIPSGSYLSGAGQYKYYSANESDTTSYDYTETNTPAGTLFSYYNNNDTASISNASWDGVVPSGAWFSLDTWSYNGQYVGFNGDLVIEPVNQDLGISMSLEVQAVGEDSRGYEEAYQRAQKKAESVFYKKLNKTLIASGCKYESKKHVRFSNMILKSAQGYFDSSNNKLVKDHDLEKSANPTGQNFNYSNDLSDGHVSSSATSSTTSSTSVSTSSSASSSSSSSSSSY